MKLGGLAAVLIFATWLLFAARLYAATRVGYGDSEALYASYALYPASAYLDHPGLVGEVTRVIGGGGAPSPFAAHLFTTFAGVALTGVFVFSAWAFGASRYGMLLAAFVPLLVPELAVGLFAITPDTLLAPLWLLGLASVALAHRRPKSSAWYWFAAGICAGAATYAKLSGALLWLAMVIHVATSPRLRRNIAAWLGLAIGVFATLPFFFHELRHGFPMYAHRMQATQGDAGLSLRNLGVTVGGQLLYVSPGFVVLGFLAARRLWRTRRGLEHELDRFLFLAFVVPVVPLTLLCLWSRVAEPHWIAPSYLALAMSYAMNAKPRTLHRVAAASGGALVVAAYLWVLVPDAARLRPEQADPSYDLTSELYGWPEVLEKVTDAARANPGAIVAGPHWTVCAQLRAALPLPIPVSCFTPIRDDFDTWSPRSRVASAPVVIFVSDNRFGNDIPAAMARLTRDRRLILPIERGGRIIRVFTLEILRENPRSLALKSGT